MSGNITHVVTDVDGNLVRAQDLPRPGTDKWAKDIIFTMLLPATDEETARYVSDNLNSNQCYRFTMLLVGDFLEMVATPRDDYLTSVRERFGEEDPDDSQTENWLVGVMLDMCRVVGRSEEFFKNIASNLVKGQVWGFNLAIYASMPRAMDENVELFSMEPIFVPRSKEEIDE